VKNIHIDVMLSAIALAGTMMVPIPAVAQLTTELSGSVGFQAGAFENRNPEELGRAFRTDVELRLRVLGLVGGDTIYGTEIQIETPDEANFIGSTSSLAVDEAYLFIAAPWGRIELGDEDGAMPKMAIRAPAIGLGQLDGDYDQFTTEALQDVAPPFYAAASEKATKITYYTPRLLGLQVGASYAPESDRANNVVAVKQSAPHDFIEGGVNYMTEIKDIGLAAGATMVRAGDRSIENPDGSYVGYQLGGQVSYGDLTVGGGYTNYDGARGIDDGYNVGAIYNRQSYAIGIQYAKMQTLDGRDFDGIAFGVSHALTDGVLLGADYVRYNSETVTREVEGNVLLLGTRIYF
jgi:outer membrane protein OmpU